MGAPRVTGGHTRCTLPRMKDHLEALLDHNTWANRRVLDTARALTAEQWTAAEWHGQPGLRGVLAHTLSAMTIWRCRLTGVPDERVRGEQFETPGALAAAWAAEEPRLRDWLATVDAENLQAPILRGQPTWHYLMQPIMHSQQHRSEAALMLTALGHSPGDMDFIAWASAERPGAG